MLRVLLLQLPIPQIYFGVRTGNVPLAAACLKLSLPPDFPAHVEILPESLTSYLGDRALIDHIWEFRPDVAGFSVFNWNLWRSIDLARRLKHEAPVAVVFGGPEITPDNPALPTAGADYLVYGEGESVFQKILGTIAKKMGGPGGRPDDAATGNPEAIGPVPYAGFSKQPSPYRSGLLEPKADGLLYLESQRGCPHQCGFCYYNKARKRIAAADAAQVIDAVGYALDQDIPEVSFTDPSLDNRRDLPDLLKSLSRLNPDKRLSLTGEIRAESVTAALADGFADAGFTGFEIGLQSVNAAALALMHRKTDITRFLAGTRLLKERGIVPRIDLIAGLPGDDPEGFRKSLAFVLDHDLSGDIQVFPLSLLPGTDFRLRSQELGLLHDPFPPYLVRQTPGFSRDAMYRAFEEAEDLLDISLFPAPYLDISIPREASSPNRISHGETRINGRAYIKTLVLESRGPYDGIRKAARRLTSPYQIMIRPTLDDARYLAKTIEILTSENPQTPLEIIFMGHDRPPDPKGVLRAARLFRPGYLDADETFRYPGDGNRGMLFTWVTRRRDAVFEGEMRRVVYWWEHPAMPEISELEALSGFDGVLVDPAASSREMMDWQDRMTERAEDLIQVAFADPRLQRRWLGLTAKEVFSPLFID